jgi:hypothetical protein
MYHPGGQFFLIHGMILPTKPEWLGHSDDFGLASKISILWSLTFEL